MYFGQLAKSERLICPVLKHLIVGEYKLKGRISSRMVAIATLGHKTTLLLIKKAYPFFPRLKDNAASLKKHYEKCPLLKLDVSLSRRVSKVVSDLKPSPTHFKILSLIGISIKVFVLTLRFGVVLPLSL